MARLHSVLVITLTMLGGCGGGGGGGDQPDAMSIVPDTYTSTGRGSPMGAPVEKTIGAAGGELATSDGRLTVVVPAGAVGADTRFVIQAITTMAPNGVGVAYRLTPEGTTFAQPVTLRFHLAAADLAGSAAEVTSIATQDADGFWRVPAGQTVDAAAGTVRVETRHFSDWTLLQDVQLQPSSASLRAGMSLPLALIACFREEVASSSDGPRYLCREGEARRYNVSRWLVNGAAGGNATVGFVSGAGSVGTYQAPQRAPRPGTVQVAAELNGPGGARALVFASVTVYDDEFVVDGRWQAVATYTQHEQSLDGSRIKDVTVNVSATLVGFMGAAIVSESGTMTYQSREDSYDPISGAGCTFTIMTSGPVLPFMNTAPTGALVFFEVPGDPDDVYYATGVPFGAQATGTMISACTDETKTEQVDVGAFWLSIPGPYEYKTPRSLDSMSDRYEVTFPGSVETWDWQITRVSGT